MGIPSYTYSVVREVHYGASISSVIVVLHGSMSGANVTCDCPGQAVGWH